MTAYIVYLIFIALIVFAVFVWAFFDIRRTYKGLLEIEKREEKREEARKELFENNMREVENWRNGR